MDSSGGRLALAPTAADAVTDADIVLTVLADGEVTTSVLLSEAVQRALEPGHPRHRPRDQRNGRGDEPRAPAATRPDIVSSTHRSRAACLPSPPAACSSWRPGRPDDVTAARTVLESFAAEVLRVGDVGAGQAMKLAVNLVVHDLNAALAEALDLAERSGVTRTEAYDVLERSVVGAPFVRYKRSAFLDPETPIGDEPGARREGPAPDHGPRKIDRRVTAADGADPARECRMPSTPAGARATWPISAGSRAARASRAEAFRPLRGGVGPVCVTVRSRSPRPSREPLVNAKRSMYSLTQHLGRSRWDGQNRSPQCRGVGHGSEERDSPPLRAALRGRRPAGSSRWSRRWPFSSRPASCSPRAASAPVRSRACCRSQPCSPSWRSGRPWSSCRAASTCRSPARCPSSSSS